MSEREEVVIDCLRGIFTLIKEIRDIEVKRLEMSIDSDEKLSDVIGKANKVYDELKLEACVDSEENLDYAIRKANSIECDLKTEVNNGSSSEGNV